MKLTKANYRYQAQALAREMKRFKKPWQHYYYATGVGNVYREYEPENAVVWYQKALASVEEVEDAPLVVIMILLWKLGELSAMESVARDVLETRKQALKKLEMHPEAGPEDFIDAYRELSAAHLWLGDYEAAMETASQGLEVEGAYAGLELLEAIRELGQRFSSNAPEAVDAAKRALEKRIEEWPSAETSLEYDAYRHLISLEQGLRQSKA